MGEEILVFGSNLQGIHGAGTALLAKRRYGAKIGIGVGFHNRSYAIPTKRTPYETLPLEEIRMHVDDFIKFASRYPHLTFEVTQIGCGLAGYTPEQIGPMFREAVKLKNVSLPVQFVLAM